MSDYSKILIDEKTGELTVLPAEPDRDGRINWLNQYFWGHDQKTGKSWQGTVCLTSKLAVSKKRLISKIIGAARQDVVKAKQKLSNLKKQLHSI